MAQKPDGKPARTERVTFTKPAAERIAKVVRAAEQGDRAGEALTFRGMPAPTNQKLFRVCTFTGSWDIGAAKTVTYKYQTSTPNTAVVQNDLMNLPSAGTRNCVIGREGTAWHLINWQWNVAYAATAAELTTSSLQFNTIPFAAVSTSSTVTFSVSVATCATA